MLDPIHNQGGAQWLSGRVLDSRPKGRGFEPHWRHRVMVLEQDTLILALVLVQPRKTRPYLTERLLMGRKESNQTNKHNQGLRLALRVFRTSPVASLYVETDEPSLYSYRKLSLQYAIRLSANPSHPAHEVPSHQQNTLIYMKRYLNLINHLESVLPLLKPANIKPKDVEEHFTPNIPAWCLKQPEILFDLQTRKKSK